jgi:hypothetical protein
MPKKPTRASTADDAVLAEVQAVRAQHAAILDTLQNLVDQVGWLGEESVQLRSDIAALRTELSHVHGDLSSRYAEALGAMRSLEPLERAAPPVTPAPQEPPDPEHNELLAAIFGQPKRPASAAKPRKATGAKAPAKRARANPPNPSL